MWLIRRRRLVCEHKVDLVQAQRPPQLRWRPLANHTVQPRRLLARAPKQPSHQQLRHGVGHPKENRSRPCQLASPQHLDQLVASRKILSAYLNNNRPVSVSGIRLPSRRNSAFPKNPSSSLIWALNVGTERLNAAAAGVIPPLVATARKYRR